MSDTKRYFLHPGFAKCASTTLQRFLFDSHPSVNNLGKPYGSRPDVHALVKKLYLTPVAAFDTEGMLTSWRKSIETRSVMNRINVLSDERLTNADGIDPGIVAERLSRVFPDATVLFVIRRPVDFLESLYSHRFSKRDVTVTFDQWFEQCVASPTNGPLERVNYATTLDAFSKSFGKDAVRVVAFEEMIENLEAFVSKICDAMSVPVVAEIPMLQGERDKSTVRISAFQHAKLSNPLIAMSELIARKVLPSIATEALQGIVRSGPKAKPTLSKKWRVLLDDRCREGNRTVASEFGINLERLGYPC